MREYGSFNLRDEQTLCVDQPLFIDQTSLVAKRLVGCLIEKDCFFVVQFIQTRSMLEFNCQFSFEKNHNYIKTKPKQIDP